MTQEQGERGRQEVLRDKTLKNPPTPTSALHPPQTQQAVPRPLSVTLSSPWHPGLLALVTP